MKRSELFFAFLLLPVDIAMIIAAFVLSYYIRIDLEVIPVISTISLTDYLRYSFIIMPVWLVLFTLNGLYYIRSTRSFLSEFYRITNASSTAILLMVMIIFFSRSLFFSRLILVLTWFLSITLIAAGRLIIKLIQQSLLRYDIGVRRILLVGDNEVSEDIVRYIAQNQGTGYKVVGVIDENGGASRQGLKILGHLDDVESIIGKYHIDEIVLTENKLNRGKTVALIQTCTDHNLVFKYVPDVYTLVTANVIASQFGSVPVMELKTLPLDGWGRIVKRIFDIFSAIIGIILSSPLIIMAIIGTKLTSPGPILYKQKRVGRDGSTFDFYKFRSMHAELCDYTEGSKWTTAHDERSRVTPFGRFLRKTSIDELPQFINVLKGDMSFVGPRPEQPKFVERFQKKIPEYFKRHRVKSGLTGWAQVNGLKGDTSIEERVRFDIYYIENWTFWLDLIIILKTVKLIIIEALGGKTEYRQS